MHTSHTLTHTTQNSIEDVSFLRLFIEKKMELLSRLTILITLLCYYAVHSIPTDISKSRNSKFRLRERFSSEDDDRSFQEKLKVFEEWLNANNASVKSLEVKEQKRDGKMQRGTFMTHDVKDISDPIMVVPRRAMICGSDALEKLLALAGNDTTATRDLKEMHQLDEKLAIAAFIADRMTISCAVSPKGVCTDDNDLDRNFDPYYDIMPSLENLEHIPINWNDEEIRRLGGLDLRDTVIRRLARLFHYFRTLRIDGVLRESTTFEAFRAAYSNVIARAFGLYTTDSGSTPCMVPYGDLLNSADGGSYNIGWSFESSYNAFVMRANSKLKQGTEVFDTYGAMKQPELFVFLYGFIPDALLPKKFQNGKRDESLKYTDVLQYVHSQGGVGYSA